MVSLGLTSLSLGLGVLFPNLNEANPSKIVSGFGGTLCLILNFLFILVFLMLFATPAVLKMRPSGTDFEKISGVLTVFCSVGIIVVTALTTVLPIFLSLRKIKRLELLGKL